MKLSKPSLAARAVAQLVDRWPSYRHGDNMAGNFNLAGLEVLGNGNFAAVVEGKPGQVIKVFNLKDAGYQFLLNYMVANPDQHFPEIYSYATSGRYGIVELERLTHDIRPAVAIANYIDRVRNTAKLPKASWGSSFQDSVLHLSQAVRTYNVTSKVQLTWDCMEDNIMFRNKTPVLVDIIYGEVSD